MREVSFQPFRLIDDLAADDSIEYVSFENPFLVNSQQVLREDHNIGQFTGRERAFDILFKGGIGIVNSICLERFHSCQPLIGIEPGAIGQSPCDRGVETFDRGNIFHWRVSTVSD